MKTFYLCALGCPRRGIDSQKIYNYLESNGYAFSEDYKNADLIVISTCAFVQERENQSVQAIEYYRGQRRDAAAMVVSGCLSKISPETIEKYDDIAFLSPRELDNFDDIIGAQTPFKDIPEPNKIFSHPLFPDFSVQAGKKVKTKQNVRLDLGYEKQDMFTLRLALGCLGNCSYCAIKFAAGSLESKPIDEIIAEFKNGLDQGYRTFTLIAGDTGCYGIDIGTTVVELLTAIFEIPGPYRLILKEFNAQWLIKYQAGLEAILKDNADKIDYIIVPVQSASDKILQRMKRPYQIEKVKDCLRAMKKKVPDLRITTHIMAGFPGETESDFQQSLDFINEFTFPYVDIYGYENRPHTEASRLEDKVAQDVIDQRVKLLRKAQEQILAQSVS